MKEVTTVGVDLAKSLLTVHGVNAAGWMVLRKTVRREKLMALIAALPARSASSRAARRTSGRASSRDTVVAWGHDGALCRGLPEEFEERRQRWCADL